MTVVIPSDIWSIVINHLKRPLPPVASNPPRSALRQPDLCSAAKVCHLFADIVNSALYVEVVSDDLFNLLSQVESPSMIYRLSMTRRLYIEYSEKGQDASYCSLFSEGRNWRRLGMSAEQRDEAILEEVQAEVSRLIIAVCGALGPKETPSVVFPRLESVAIGTLYGSQGVSWGHYHVTNLETSPKLLDDYDQLSESFDELLSRMPKLQHLCSRDTDGPLTIQADPTSLCFRTAHIAHGLPGPTIYPGYPIRIVSDISPTEDWTPSIRAFDHCLSELGRTRGLPGGSIFGSKTIHADVYCSSGLQIMMQPNGMPVAAEWARKRLSGEAQREETAGFGKELQAALRKASGLPDVIRWFPSADTPICQACGTGPPV